MGEQHFFFNGQDSVCWAAPWRHGTVYVGSTLRPNFSDKCYKIWRKKNWLREIRYALRSCSYISNVSAQNSSFLELSCASYFSSLQVFPTFTTSFPTLFLSLPGSSPWPANPTTPYATALSSFCFIFRPLHGSVGDRNSTGTQQWNTQWSPANSKI